MPNFVLFGQNDRITVHAESFRRVSSNLSENDSSFGAVPYQQTQPYYEFVDARGQVVAMLNEYQYGNIIREDALRENR